MIQTPGGLATHPIHAETECDALAEIAGHFDRISSVIKPEWRPETEWSVHCTEIRSGVNSAQSEPQGETEPCPQLTPLKT